jgi:xanthine dehydrogenase accessory factor
MSATASELLAVLAELEREDGEQPRPLALATLVAVRGSAYRQPGARLLVREDGSAVGNLTGGCLDAEIVEAAHEVDRTQTAKVVTFDLTGEEEAILGWGMGCNGVLEILVEPAAAARSAGRVVAEAVLQRRRTAVLTVIAGDARAVGERWWQVESGELVGPTGEVPTFLAASAARNALAAGRTGVVAVPSQAGPVQAFIEVLQPPPRLVVCGAGDDAVPVTRRGADLGWDVVVVDHRRFLLHPDRYPEGTTLVHADRNVAEKLPVDGNTHVVVMSHNFLRDRDYLGAALRTQARYIGMLGPRLRLQRLLDDLGRDGVLLTARDGARLHGPAGLDLGAQGPDEIALSIVAEVLAASRGRSSQIPMGRTYAPDAAEPAA